METITPHELYALQQEGQTIVILDVRSPGEFNTFHIEGAMHRPITKFDAEQVIDALTAAGHGERKIYVTCAVGPRAHRACEQLQSANFTNLVVLEGGTTAWESAGLPGKRSVEAMPIPLQAKLVQGGVIVASILLALLGLMFFLVFPLIIGGLMVYSAFTGNLVIENLLAYLRFSKKDKEG